MHLKNLKCFFVINSLLTVLVNAQYSNDSNEFNFLSLTIHSKTQRIEMGWKNITATNRHIILTDYEPIRNFQSKIETTKRIIIVPKSTTPTTNTTTTMILVNGTDTVETDVWDSAGSGNDEINSDSEEIIVEETNLIFFHDNRSVLESFIVDSDNGWITTSE